MARLVRATHELGGSSNTAAHQPRLVHCVTTQGWPEQVGP
jgi:hypothetical protein